MSHQDLASTWSLLHGRPDIDHILCELIGRHNLDLPLYRGDQARRRKACFHHVVALKAVFDLQRTYLQSVELSLEARASLLQYDVLFAGIIHLLDIKSEAFSCNSRLPDQDAYSNLFALTLLSGLRALLLRKQVLAPQEHHQLKEKFDHVRRDECLNDVDHFVINSLCCRIIQELASDPKGSPYAEPACGTAHLPDFYRGLYPVENREDFAIEAARKASNISLSSPDWFHNALVLYDLCWATVAALTQLCMEIQKQKQRHRRPLSDEAHKLNDLHRHLILTHRFKIQEQIYHDAVPRGPNGDPEWSTEQMRTLLSLGLHPSCAQDQCLCFGNDIADVQNLQLHHGGQGVLSRKVKYLTVTRYLRDTESGLRELHTALDLRVAALADYNGELKNLWHALNDYMHEWRPESTDSTTRGRSPVSYTEDIYVMNCPELHPLPASELYANLSGEKGGRDKLQSGAPFLYRASGNIRCEACDWQSDQISARRVEPLSRIADYIQRQLHAQQQRTNHRLGLTNEMRNESVPVSIPPQGVDINREQQSSPYTPSESTLVSGPSNQAAEDSRPAKHEVVNGEVKSSVPPVHIIELPEQPIDEGAFSPKELTATSVAINLRQQGRKASIVDLKHPSRKSSEVDLRPPVPEVFPAGLKQQTPGRVRPPYPDQPSPSHVPQPRPYVGERRPSNADPVTPELDLPTPSFVVDGRNSFISEVSQTSDGSPGYDQRRGTAISQVTLPQSPLTETRAVSAEIKPIARNASPASRPSVRDRRPSYPALLQEVKRLDLVMDQQLPPSAPPYSEATHGDSKVASMVTPNRVLPLSPLASAHHNGPAPTLPQIDRESYPELHTPNVPLPSDSFPEVVNGPFAGRSGPSTVVSDDSDRASSRFVSDASHGKKNKWSLFGKSRSSSRLSVIPSAVFFANGKSLLIWTERGGGCYDIHNSDSIGFRKINATPIYLAAGGAQKCAVTSKVGADHTMKIFQGNFDKPVRELKIETVPHAIAVSANDQYVAIKFSRYVQICDTVSGETTFHELPHLNRRTGRNNHLVAFSNDSRSFIASTRFEPEKVINYWAECTKPSAVNRIESSAPFGLVGDEGLSSVVYSGTSNGALITTFTEKGHPTLLFLGESDQSSRTMRDPIGQIGSRIHRAALSETGTELVLVNQRNDIFWLSNPWMPGPEQKARQVGSLKRATAVKRDVEMGMPNTDEVHIFWIDKGRGQLLTMGRSGGKSKPVELTVDIEQLTA